MSLFYAKIILDSRERFVGVYSTQEKATIALRDVLSNFHTTKEIAETAYNQLSSLTFDDDNEIEVYILEEDFIVTISISLCKVDETVKLS